MLEVLVKLPLPSLSPSIRTTFGRLPKLLPMESLCRYGFCANRTPSLLMMFSVLSLPMSRLLNY